MCHTAPFCGGYDSSGLLRDRSGLNEIAIPKKELRVPVRLLTVSLAVRSVMISFIKGRGVTTGGRDS